MSVVAFQQEKGWPAEAVAMDASGRYLTKEQFIWVAAEFAYEALSDRESLTSTPRTRAFLALRLSGRPHEVFCCIFLDNQHRVIAFEELFRGTIDGTSVHSREVVIEALKHNAAAVIFAHNHPSGNLEPSRADRALTRRLVDALGLVDIRVLDHFIVGDGEPYSFAEMGLLE